PDAGVRLPAGGQEGGEDLRRKARMQRPAARGVDVHPVALEAVGRGAVALVDGDLDAAPAQALRQGKAADPAADHDRLQLQRGRSRARIPSSMEFFYYGKF